MAIKFLVLSAVLAVANAGFLSLGYGNGGSAGAGNGGGSSLGLGGGNNGGSLSGGSNYYNNAPLALNHGPLPQQAQQQAQQPIQASISYGPAPPLASSSSFRHQISVSHPVQVPVAVTSYGYGNRVGGGYGGNAGYGASAGYGGNAGSGNGGLGGRSGNGGYGGYGGY